MTPDGTSKDDVKVPEGEIGTQISSGFEEGKDLLVTIVSAMGEEQVSFAIPAFGYKCAYKLVGHLIQGSPERLLVHTPTRLVDISCLPRAPAFLRPSIYRPYGRHSVVHVLFSWLDSACVLQSRSFGVNELHGLRS